MNKGIHIEGVCIENIDTYSKKCDTIIKLLKRNYKNCSIKYEQLSKIDLVYIMVDNRIKLAIMPEVKWNDLKKHIDLELKSIYGKRMCEECSGEIKCIASCNKCHNNTCLECYIENFKLNKGIVKCKICSYSFGVEIPDEYIDLAIDDIRSNTKIKKK